MHNCEGSVKIYLKIKKRGCYYRINKDDLSDYINRLYVIVPEAYKKIKLLLYNNIGYDQVKSVTKIEKPVDVYDLTVNESEQFTVNGIVVHNCKHGIALAEYLKTNINAPTPDDDNPPPEKEIEPKPEITPETPPTTDAPKPDDGYSDSRGGLDEITIPTSNLYKRIEAFVKNNQTFDVAYE